MALYCAFLIFVVFSLSVNGNLLQFDSLDSEPSFYPNIGSDERVIIGSKNIGEAGCSGKFIAYKIIITTAECLLNKDGSEKLPDSFVIYGHHKVMGMVVTLGNVERTYIDQKFNETTNQHNNIGFIFLA